MKLIDEAAMQRARDRRQCELCGRRCGYCDPHHYTSRGFGGGTRFDHDRNLCSLCFWCHQSFHDSGVDRKQFKRRILEAIARREGLEPDALEQWLWDQINASKDSLQKEEHEAPGVGDSEAVP